MLPTWLLPCPQQVSLEESSWQLRNFWEHTRYLSRQWSNRTVAGNLGGAYAESWCFRKGLSRIPIEFRWQHVRGHDLEGGACILWAFFFERERILHENDTHLLNVLCGDSNIWLGGYGEKIPVLLINQTSNWLNREVIAPMLEDHVIILVLKGNYATDEELLIREVMHFMGVQDRFPISRIKMRDYLP